MKKLMLAALVAMLATPASAQSIIVTGPQPTRDDALPVAYDALRTGQTQRAIAELEACADTLARDPSRLINLGTAYARLGQRDRAAAQFRAAVASPIRYDLELADGRYVDSRWAARTALDRLDRGAPQLALATR